MQQKKPYAYGMAVSHLERGFTFVWSALSQSRFVTRGENFFVRDWSCICRYTLF